MDKNEFKAMVQDLKSRLRITKVTVTRSVKGRNGDSFVGFSAEFESTQDDSSQGLDSVHGEPSRSGISLKEAQIATFILGMKVDAAAFEKAAAGSTITLQECNLAKSASHANYNLLIAQCLKDGKGEG